MPPNPNGRWQLPTALNHEGGPSGDLCSTGERRSEQSPAGVVAKLKYQRPIQIVVGRHRHCIRVDVIEDVEEEIQYVGF